MNINAVIAELQRAIEASLRWEDRAGAEEARSIARGILHELRLLKTGCPEWIKLTNRMPSPDEHDRVLIYTEGQDFNGEQVFDVMAETLNECFYADPEDQPEVCKHASHWSAHPRYGIGFTVDVDELLAAFDDLVRIEAAASDGVLPSFSSVKAALEAALGGHHEL